MRCKAPDKTFFTDLRDLNAGFMSLIQQHRPGSGSRALGLDAAVVERIRVLPQSEADFLAAAPYLLAEFTALPTIRVVGEALPPPSRQDRRWQESARVFAASLMTYLRLMASRDRLTTVLCVGPGLEVAEALATVPLREIQARAGLAVHLLEARFADNPRFWPDMLRAARSGDEEMRALACLAGIPLCLSRRRDSG